MRADFPNGNGRIYPMSALEHCVEKAKAGPVLGSLGLTEGVSVALSEVSHTVENLRIEEGYLVGDVTVLDTPKGQALEKLIDSCDFRSTGTGLIRGGHVVDYNLISIDAVLDGGEAVKCSLAPKGWSCSRSAGHEGPCAAWPATFWLKLKWSFILRSLSPWKEPT